MEDCILYAKRQLHIGFPWMLGKIIKIDFGEVFDLVTVRYDDGEDKVFKVQKVG